MSICDHMRRHTKETEPAGEGHEGQGPTVLQDEAVGTLEPWARVLGLAADDVDPADDAAPG